MYAAHVMHIVAIAVVSRANRNDGLQRRDQSKGEMMAVMPGTVTGPRGIKSEEVRLGAAPTIGAAIQYRRSP